MNIRELNERVGGLSEPSKMPWYSYNLPATRCKVGSKLRPVVGSTCNKCYALKGRYVFPNVVDALERRYQALINNPNWAEDMATLINMKAKGTKQFFRWHDSGDLQSVEHLDMICQVAKQTPNIQHWLPTREYHIVKTYRQTNKIPKNLTVRLSAHMVGGYVPAKLALPFSTVSKDRTYNDAHICPAPTQGNTCSDCRACWNSDVKHVDYHLH